MKCPICGLTEFEKENNYDICNCCGWENDGVQLCNPDLTGGANVMSLNQAKAHWQGILKIQREINPSIEIGKYIQAESEHYLIQHDFEGVYLFAKTENKTICVGDHYGDPQGSFIDKNEKWVCSYGEGLTVYFLKAPYKSYDRGECKNQWFNYGQGTTATDVIFIENVIQIDDWKLLVVEADTLKEFEIEIPH